MSENKFKILDKKKEELKELKKEYDALKELKRLKREIKKVKLNKMLFRTFGIIRKEKEI